MNDSRRTRCINTVCTTNRGAEKRTSQAASASHRVQELAEEPDGDGVALFRDEVSGYRGPQGVRLVFLQHDGALALGHRQRDDVSSEVKAPDALQEARLRRRRRQRGEASHPADVGQRGGVSAKRTDHGADPRAPPQLLADLVRHSLPGAVDRVRKRAARGQGRRPADRSLASTCRLITITR